MLGLLFFGGGGVCLLFFIFLAQGFNAADLVSHPVENSGPALKVLSLVNQFPSELIKASAR